MGLLNTCIVAAKRNLRVDQGSLGSISASVTLVDPGVSDFRIEVQDGPVGYRWVADCLRGCGKGMRYSQDISDTPISLFRLWDGDDLIYSVWAGGSAYRVRVWKVGVTGVAKLLKASSASRPEFLTMSGGEQAVRTRERSEGPEAGRSIVWTYRDGVFRGNSDPERLMHITNLRKVGGSVMLAKGNRSASVREACKKHGGFYLGSIGGPAARLAQDCIRKVEVLEYPELGMEAIWKIDVEDFPAFIVVDDKGNDFFKELNLG
eukprot:gene12463-16614_t